MKNSLLFIRVFLLLGLIMLFISNASAQCYSIGPASPAIGTSANYTTHNHFNLFNVLNTSGVYFDSITIYPATASASYTIVVQNSAQTVIASSSGTTTIGGNQAERVKVNLFVPVGTGYRLGLTTSSVGMLRNSTGAVFPYTVPNVMTFTGATFGSTYWYFFYNIKIYLPSLDAGISAITTPGDTICGGSQAVNVTLKNFHCATMTSAKINWSVNNVVQPLYNWTGSLAENATTNVNIGSYNFLSGNTYNLKVWSSEPNNLVDPTNSNDTLVKSGIVVKPSPTAAFTTTNTNICPGDSIIISGNLTGSPPWSVVINDGSGNYTFSNLQLPVFAVSISPQSTITYTLVSVTDSTGCTSNVGQSVVITVLPNPPATLTPVSSTTFCEGDSVILQANTGAGLTYEYRKDGVIQIGSSFTFVAYQSGSYTVTITNADGCDSTSAPVVVTVNPLPVVDLGNDTIIGVSQSLTLDAGPGFISYLWSTGDTTQTIIADSTGIGAGIGTFSVTVTDVNTCEGSDDIQINFVTNPGIDEAQGSKRCTIYPNPAKDFISFESDKKAHIEIINTQGQVIEKLHTTNTKTTVDISNFSDGIYFIKASTDDGITVKKFIKQ